MVDPELADLGIRRGQGQAVGFGMGEEGGVEVTAQTSFLAEVHPLSKVLRLQLVPVYPVAILKNGIAGVEVHLLGAGAQLQHHVQVSHQLFGSSGAAGIIAGGLDATSERLGGIGIEATDIVALPAVQRNGNVLEFCNRSISIDTKSRIFNFCFCIRHIN